MQAACIQSNNTLGVAEVQPPSLPDGGALIRVLGCGVCGSDLDKLRHGKAKPGAILGHEVVGVIQALSPKLSDKVTNKGFSVGDRVALAHHVPCGECHYCTSYSPSMCRVFKATNIKPGGFAELVAVSGEHLEHTVFFVPYDVDDAVASCIEPLGCVLRAIERGGIPEQNPSAAVIGLGFIGQMAAQTYQQADCLVLGIDVDTERCGLSVSNGFVHAAFHPTEHHESLTQTLAARTAVGAVDVVFLSVVTAETVQMALDIVRDGGTIVLFASSSRPMTTIPLNELFFREINVISSYSPSVEHLGLAAQWIGDKRINLEPLISHQVTLEDLPQAMADYQSGQAMKVFVSMRSSWAFPDVPTKSKDVDLQPPAQVS